MEFYNKVARALYLLQCANNLLVKQRDSHFVLNMLEETIIYDGAECDGNCLLEDIKNCLDDIGIKPDKEASYIDYPVYKV